MRARAKGIIRITPANLCTEITLPPLIVERVAYDRAGAKVAEVLH